MVVLSKPAIEQFSIIKTPKPSKTTKQSTTPTSFPTIDLSKPDPIALVKACEDVGFFKVINHSIPFDTITTLESEAVKFFSLPNTTKELSGPANPFGYGNKSIGRNGDVGWVEYLLMTADNPTLRSNLFKSAVEDYLKRVRLMTCEIVELMAKGLGIRDREVFSRLLKDEQSDSLFRLNHYPPCPQELMRGFNEEVNLVGFGEHTDPQIVSVLRSNNTSGLEIELKNGSWVSVPSDQSAFFVNVGDSLQVMTNGRFKSVRHRVVANTYKSRISMIYFGGPPIKEKIAPIPALLMGNQNGGSLYKEFTWGEYKTSAYKSRLADNRLELFQKKIAAVS